MSQSCETLVMKINEWQKAILELEKLSDEFLNSGDKGLKVEIKNKKQEIVSREKEYQKLVYQELPNGEKLFWPEKEALEELMSKTDNDLTDLLNSPMDTHFKNKHLISFDFTDDIFDPLRVNMLIQRSINLDLSRFQMLIYFCADEPARKDRPPIDRIPKLPRSIEEINVRGVKFTEKERQQIMEEYPNTMIVF